MVFFFCGNSSVRQNVLAFLADLFFLLEIRPAKCVRPAVLMRDRFQLAAAAASVATTTANASEGKPLVIFFYCLRGQ